MRLLLFILFLSWTLRANALCIVSLNPAITETLFALNLGKEICGTTTFSNFPAEAKKIPQVGSYLKPSIEKIISLHPTHVLVFKEGDPSIKSSLERAKIPTTVFDDLTLNGFPNFVTTLGNTFHREKEAKDFLSKWTTQIGMLGHYRINKKILIEVDHNPIFVAGENTFLSEVLKKCLLTNIFSNFSGYRRVSTESVMNHKPDVILVVGQLHEQEDFSKVQSFWKSNPATNSALVIKGDADVLSRFGPRLPEAALQICDKIKNSTSL